VTDNLKVLLATLAIIATGLGVGAALYVYLSWRDRRGR
jgi:hypothetical protein